MPPPKARLHNKTGKLKTINKAYTSRDSSSSDTVVISNGAGWATRSAPLTATNTSATQTETVPSSSRVSVVPEVAAPNPVPSNDSEVDQQFELELYWCIQTMEKSLDSGSLSAKQAADTEKTIKLLKSHSQSVIRKRQIMRTAFGDYRSKMVEEEKKLRLGSRQIQFVDPKNDKEKAKSKSHFVKKSLAAALGEKDFKFNFPIPDIDKLNLEDAAGTDDKPDVTPAKTPNPTQPQASPATATPKAIINSKFVPSDNSFKFNFSQQN